MVHGYRGDHHGLEPVIAAAADGVRIISPDLPGFGESTPLDGTGHRHRRLRRAGCTAFVDAARAAGARR